MSIFSPSISLEKLEADKPIPDEDELLININPKRGDGTALLFQSTRSSIFDWKFEFESIKSRAVNTAIIAEKFTGWCCMDHLGK